MMMILIEKKKKKSRWSAIKNRTEFLCGKKRFSRWWSVVSLEAKITPWPKRLKLFSLPPFSALFSNLLSCAMFRVIKTSQVHNYMCKVFLSLI